MFNYRKNEQMQWFATKKYSHIVVFVIYAHEKKNKFKSLLT